jgi:hypothetical protein
MFAAKNELFTTPSGYQIQRSLRFRSSATAYLNRTPASASNLQKFTWSGWVKRGKLASYTPIFCSNGGNTTDSNFFMVQWLNTDTIAISGALTDWRITTQVFRDPSAWYHIVFAVDTTLATAANRILLYINGVQVTAFGTSSNPTQNLNTAVNNTNAHYISTFNGSGNPSDMYLAEVNFIDGQALTPSSFGAINATTGVWSATRYNGTYGTNGFYLPFTDNSAATATTIGKDYSGNGNNWTPNNISVTSGVSYDSMLDAPLGAGGGERGNYSVANPISTLYTVTAGNLDFTYTNSTTGVWYLKGTLAVSSNKYYWEVIPSNVGAGQNISIGIVLSTNTQTNTTTINLVTDGYVYHCDGNKYSGSSGAVAYGATYTDNDVIGVALDLTAGTLVFYKNNVSQGTAFTGLTSSYMQLICNHLGGASRTVAGSVNAGQRPFVYTPPTGFKALHTGNLGAPVIALPAQNMAATLYAGTSVAQSIVNTVNGVSFQPDFVWGKNRTNVNSHRLTDVNRGVGKVLFSNDTAGDTTGDGQLSSFNSNGFGLTGGTGAFEGLNQSGSNYVAWQWKAGGTAVSNTAGSITSSVSANTTAGFSVVTYTGTGVTATVGHGLGVAPSMVMVKSRSNNTGDGFVIYHKSLPSADYWLDLSTTGAQSGPSSAVWNGTAPTSTVFSIKTASGTNTNTYTYVAYCFAPVAGYSAFGSYTGNGSADGPFVYTGFRPRFIMWKRTDTTSGWSMHDTSRDPYNISTNNLFADTSGAEDTGDSIIDLLSNGFKLRNTYARANASGGTYIYMAFAESPFRNSLAR